MSFESLKKLKYFKKKFAYFVFCKLKIKCYFLNHYYTGIVLLTKNKNIINVQSNRVKKLITDAYLFGIIIY